MTSQPAEPHNFADPRRSLERLWGRTERGRRGPKPKLSLKEVVAAAIALADEVGLEALSMRRVAEKVGLSPMALYTYAPSKAELVELMFDRALSELEDPDPALGWREGLVFGARQAWALAHRHPWMLQVSSHRPPLGPHFMHRMEVSLRVLDGMGLTDVEMKLVEGLLSDYVRGAIRSALEAREVEQRSGLTDEQWMAIAEPALQEVLDPEAFPMLRRVGKAYRAALGDALDRERGFEFGLQRVLDGVELFISRKNAAA